MTANKKLGIRKVSAILAGLRLLQQHRDPVPGGSDVEEILTNGGKIAPLSIGEINDLCEEINCNTVVIQ